MSLAIEGKTALVLEGAGLVSSAALALGREGCNVAVSDTNGDKLTALVKRLSNQISYVFPQIWNAADLSADQSIRSALKGPRAILSAGADTQKLAFLASTRVSYVKGSIARVDGGLIPSICGLIPSI